jgi:hypothetical protein
MVMMGDLPRRHSTVMSSAAARARNTRYFTFGFTCFVFGMTKLLPFALPRAVEKIDADEEFHQSPVFDCPPRPPQRHQGELLRAAAACHARDFDGFDLDAPAVPVHVVAHAAPRSDTVLAAPSARMMVPHIRFAIGRLSW